MRFIFLCWLFLMAACAAQSASGTSANIPNDLPTNLPAPNASAPLVRSNPSPESSAFLQFDSQIHLIDLTTGKDAVGYDPIHAEIPVFSDDGKFLAAVESHGESCEPSGGGVACRPSAATLHVLDLQTQHQLTIPLPADGWVGSISFPPDTNRLVMAYNRRESSTIMLADVDTARVVSQREIEFRPTLLHFAPDRKTLAVYGQARGDDPDVSRPPAPQVILLDVASLQVTWQQTLDNVVSGSWCVEGCQGSHEQQLAAAWYPAVIPSRDGRYLYIVHADADQLTTIDLSERKIRTTAVQTARSWFEDFLAMTANVAEAKGGVNGSSQYATLSPDGSRLYVIGQTMKATHDTTSHWDTIYASGDLQVIDTQSGKRLDSRAMENRQAISEYLDGVSVTPDGAHVCVVRSDEQNHWWTEIFDATSLQPTTQLKDWRVLITSQLNGEPMLLAHQPNAQPLRLGLVDPATFRVTRSWLLASNAGWVSP